MKYLKKLTSLGVTSALIGALATMGCLGPHQVSTQEHMETDIAQGVAEDSVIAKRDSKYKHLPDSVNEAMMPNMLVSAGRVKGSSEKRFDLFAEEVPARSFFLSLVQGTPYNITIHPEVKGTISLQLKRVTIAQILAAVRNVYGFDYRKSSGTLEILPATLQTRSYKINYIDVDRKGNSEITVSAGSLSNTTTPGGSNSGSGSGTNGGVATTSVGGTTSTSTTDNSTQTINSQIKSNNKSDFWVELKTTVENMVGTTEGRRVATSPMSGLLVVQAMPDELRKVEDFLRKAELTLNKQVILEAKIFEVQLNDAFQAGINWEILTGRTRLVQYGGDVIQNGLNAGDPFPIDSNQTAGQSISLDPGKPPGVTFNPGSNVGSFGGVFALAMNYKNLATFVELLSGQGDVHVLSNPRVSTMNNQKAVIKVGKDQFFITNVSTTTTSVGTTTTQTPNVTFNSFFSGVSLDVTPSINERNEITLHIHPMVSLVENDTLNFTLNGQAQSVPLALSNVRESDNVVKAKNGQMVVIGGLMQDNTQYIREGIPVLKDLPVLGMLFGHTVEKVIKSELVILLRPIIANDNSWTEAIDDTLLRFEKLERECE
jgi:MSHA biogenesis protein MshL